LFSKNTKGNSTKESPRGRHVLLGTKKKERNPLPTPPQRISPTLKGGKEKRGLVVGREGPAGSYYYAEKRKGRNRVDGEVRGYLKEKKKKNSSLKRRNALSVLRGRFAIQSEYMNKGRCAGETKGCGLRKTPREGEDNGWAIKSWAKGLCTNPNKKGNRTLRVVQKPS